MNPDQYVQDKAASSGSSFYYAFLFLPKERRAAITAFYAFCREVDDVVDEVTDPGVAATKLAWWKSEVHKGFSPLFNPATPEDYKTVVRERLMQRLQWVDSQLAGKQYLMGDQFTVADGYLFTTSNWASHVKVDISGLHHLAAYRERVAARPAVQAAMKAEGLLK